MPIILPDAHEPYRVRKRRLVQVDAFSRVVHVLRDGKTLCGYGAGQPPKAWPSHHVFVQWDNENTNFLSNCPPCQRRIREMTP